MHQECRDDSIEADALASAGRPRDQQVRHLREITDDSAPVDIASQWQRKFRLPGSERFGLQHFPQPDRRDLLVGDFHAHASLAGDRRFHAHGLRPERQGQVVLQLADTTHLDAVAWLQRELGHCRARVDFPHSRGDLEAQQGLLD